MLITLLSASLFACPVTPPSERVHFILGEDDHDGLHVSHPLFSELEELVSTGEDGEMEWRERAR